MFRAFKKPSNSNCVSPSIRSCSRPVTPDNGLLIAVERASGIRRLAVSRGSGVGPDHWAVQERWTSTALKPHFNDFVVHNGHAYGFDASIMSCIDLKDGARKWKGGRYGNGQLVLLADQYLLLVLSEEGELALVSATPAEFKEIARFKAIEGKTWNHPVLVGDTVLVRNGEEMAAFRLSLATKIREAEIAKVSARKTRTELNQIEGIRDPNGRDVGIAPLVPIQGSMPQTLS
jgi:hypothetical protein